MVGVTLAEFRALSHRCWSFSSLRNDKWRGLLLTCVMLVKYTSQASYQLSARVKIVNSCIVWTVSCWQLSGQWATDANLPLVQGMMSEEVYCNLAYPMIGIMLAVFRALSRRCWSLSSPRNEPWNCSVSSCMTTSWWMSFMPTGHSYR